MHIAKENRLPLVHLVESGGADLPTQSDLFIPGGRSFRDITELSAAGIPTISVVFGNSTAGGAYLPGMSDYIVMIKKRSKVFLGGPPLVKMATGEESDDESLGGAEMHSRISGLSDYFALDELDGHPARPPGRAPPQLHASADPAHVARARPPRLDQRADARHPVVDPRVPFDPRDVIARVVDDSDFDEFKPLYGTSLVTGFAEIYGYPIGILANHRGVLFNEEAQKAHAVHPARQPDRHPARVPAEHDGLHGRQGVRAARDHQGRGEDDQRRRQQLACRT